MSKMNKLTKLLEDKILDNNDKSGLNKDEENEEDTDKELEEVIDEEEKKVGRCIRLYKILRMMQIDPTTKKYIIFRNILCISLYADFLLSATIFGNYRFSFELEDDFISDWMTIYNIIIAIHTLNIYCNFFVTLKINLQTIDNPFVIIKNYFKGDFMLDAVTTYPWFWEKRYLIIIRLLKIKRLNQY